MKMRTKIRKKKENDHQESNKKWDLKCSNCGKKGHFVRDYWFRKKKMTASNVTTSSG